MSRQPEPKAARADGLRRRMRLLSPLRQRDFALLWTGMTVSLIGDGIYFVAIAWLAYSISNAPTALSIVGVAWTLPMVGGAVSDRIERRRVLLISNLTEAVAIGAIGVLTLTGVLEMWMLLPRDQASSVSAARTPNPASPSAARSFRSPKTGRRSAGSTTRPRQLAWLEMVHRGARTARGSRPPNCYPNPGAGLAVQHRARRAVRGPRSANTWQPRATSGHSRLDGTDRSGPRPRCAGNPWA